LDKELYTSNPNLLDIDGYHGNYQAVRSNKCVIEYCNKEGDYISNQDIEAIKAARKYKKKVIGSQLISGEKNLLQVVQQNPELVFGLSNLTRDIAHLKQLNWVPKMRDVKAYWYYGPTRTGKSWKAIADMGYPISQEGLQCDLTGIYFKNSQNKWWDGYQG
jgi:hypothetical protein